MKRNLPRYIPGQNWVVCSLCGFKVRASESRYNSDGLLVCNADYEPEHPLDKHVYTKKEKITPDKVSPEPTVVYVDTATVGEFPYTFPLILE